MSWEIHTGDCIEEMRKLEENSVDAVVTDPPYGIGFMGREWDVFAPAAIAKRETQPDRKGTERTSAAYPAIEHLFTAASSPQAEVQDCETCGGEGAIPDHIRVAGGTYESRWGSRKCPDCKGTGKPPPAEPQGATKLDAPASESTSSPDSCPEPQGDVVEVVSARIIDAVAEHFPDDNKYALCLRLQYAVPLIRADLALEVKERLEAEGEKSVKWKCPVHGFAAGANVCQVLDNPSKTNDESPRCLKRCEVVEFVTVPLAAFHTPAPSEPEEGRDA